ncbi:MAG TPA: tetratricopeptide repeat protein [Candidatus Eisenbacteria bacterium]|nr:tetratricopeptide repeat protein [Candidatus Eisenbacteria bacterium]
MSASVSSFRIRAVVLLVSAASILGSSAAQQTAPARHKPAADSVGQSELTGAESLFQEGRLADAKTSVQRFLRSYPSSVDGYNLMGIICSNQQDYDCSLHAFQRALNLNPSSATTHINLGNFYAAAGKTELAEKELRKALALFPSNQQANYNLALILLTAGKPAAAIPFLQRIHPATVEAKMNLVRAYLRASRTTEGLSLAKQISLESKNDVQRHFTLGLLLASEKQYKSAEFEVEKADSLTPGTFEILYNLGQILLSAGDTSKAELVLHRALTLKPDSADTMYLLAQAYQEESRPVDALDSLARAHKIAPENTDIIFLLARVSMTQNFYEDAIPLLESGIKLAPQRLDLHAALGESYFMSGKADKAIEEFKTLIELDPSARSYAFMGLSYRHLGRFDEARKYFEEGLKRDPKNAACLFNIGFIEERQGNTSAADEKLQQALRSNPNFAEALLELANLRTKDKKYAEAADLLRRYVKASRDPAPGYYKLAMLERSLHQMDAARRDLQVFQTLSKNSSTGPYPFQHLFDYLDNRSQLSARERATLDITELNAQIKKNPGQPQDLYLLAEAYLKLGQHQEALATVTQLDQVSSGDYRTQAGLGVLLARYHLYDDAISHFQTALRANSDSDEIKFDLANAYFRKGSYPEALRSIQAISTAGQQDDTCLSLLGDVYAHLGQSMKSVDIFRDAIVRNPDNDQYYLSLMLVQLRSGDPAGAEQTLKKGLDRIPASGKIQWGLGLISALQGDTARAGERLERAVDLLPEWAGSYSTLGVFYYQTGQIDKAREVLSRFKGSNAGGLDVQRIEQVLSQTSGKSAAPNEPLTAEARQQLLQFALIIADRTL